MQFLDQKRPCGGGGGGGRIRGGAQAGGEEGEGIATRHFCPYVSQKKFFFAKFKIHPGLLGELH